MIDRYCCKIRELIIYICEPTFLFAKLAFINEVEFPKWLYIPRSVPESAQLYVRQVMSLNYRGRRQM